MGNRKDPKEEQGITLDMPSEAFYGLAGQIVAATDPHTEAARELLLLNHLVFFGNVIGRGPYYKVEETRHYTNIYGVAVGPTSKARKGQSLSTIEHMYRAIDPDWLDKRKVSGLSSGEGLVYQVRDASSLGAVTRKNEFDPGVQDKRLLVIEEEFSQSLTKMRSDGNILSQIIRDAWDGKSLTPLTKNNRIKATEPHISILGHITMDELRKQLSMTEMTNGFANRFIWLCVGPRTKVLANPTGVPDKILTPLISKLKTAVTFAKGVGQMKRDSKAEKLWTKVYPQLSEGKPALVGAITSRAEAQVLRLSMIYALMDCSSVIKPPHLKAALAFWKYSEASVNMIFGERLGDPSVDEVAKSLRIFGKVTRSQIWDILGHSGNKKEIQRVIEVLNRAGIADVQNENGTEVLLPKRR